MLNLGKSAQGGLKLSNFFWFFLFFLGGWDGVAVGFVG